MSHLGGLYFDKNTEIGKPTLLSIEGNFVVELSGLKKSFKVEGSVFVSLIHELASKVAEAGDSLFGHLARTWKDEIEGEKYYSNFVEWFSKLKLDEMSTKRLNRIIPKAISELDDYKQDFETLVIKVINQGFIFVRYN